MLLGSSTEAKFLHSEKALDPISKTLLGIDIEVRPRFPVNEPLQIFKTSLGMSVEEQPTMRRLLSFSIIALQLLRES